MKLIGSHAVAQLIEDDEPVDLDGPIELDPAGVPMIPE